LHADIVQEGKNSVLRIKIHAKVKKLYESKHANFLVHGKEKQSRGRGEGLEASRAGYIHPATSDNLHFSTTTPGDG
jgi:hypothetical protein